MGKEQALGSDRLIESVSYLLDATATLLAASSSINLATFLAVILGAVFAAITGLAVTTRAHNLETKRLNRDFLINKLEELFLCIKEELHESATSASRAKRKTNKDGELTSPLNKVDVIVACHFQKELGDIGTKLMNSCAKLHSSIRDHHLIKDHPYDLVEKNQKEHVQLISLFQFAIVQLVKNIKSQD